MNTDMLPDISAFCSVIAASIAGLMAARSKSQKKRIDALEDRLEDVETANEGLIKKNGWYQRALIAAHDYIYQLRLTLPLNGIETPEPPEDLNLHISQERDEVL